MSRTRTRMLAAGTAMLVAAAVALPATAPAFAGVGPTFDAHGNKDFADVGDPNVFFLVELDGLPSSCIEARPVVNYILSVTSPDGPVPDTQGTMDTYTDLGDPYYEVWLPLENFSEGEVYTLDASTNDPCFGDGQSFSDSATITINGGDVPEEPGDGGDDDPWEYEGDGTAYGTVYVQNVANSASPADWAPRTGVEVGLYDVERPGDGPVDTDTTDPSGEFELTAPFGEPGDDDILYLIVANVDGDPYFYENDRGPSEPSPTDPDDADWMYVYEFDGETSFDLYAGTLPEPTWSLTGPALTVGVAYDQTFTAPSTTPWNWGWGGDIDLDYDVLPAGMEIDVVSDSWEEDVVPALRIHGTPTEAGPYSFWVYLEDDYGHWTEFEVSGTVAPAGSGSGGSGGSGAEGGSTDPLPSEESRDLDLDLDLEVGGQISGSEAVATASGLQEGADYDVVVRSTPQTLAVGTVPAGGTVSRAVTLPTLEAGWHSLTFTSTWAGGGTAVAKLWFQVSASGTLLAISHQAPNLANTGSNIGGTVLLSSFALLAGFGMMALRRRRSATA